LWDRRHTPQIDYMAVYMVKGDRTAQYIHKQALLISDVRLLSMESSGILKSFASLFGVWYEFLGCFSNPPVYSAGCGETFEKVFPQPVREITKGATPSLFPGMLHCLSRFYFMTAGSTF
uniref:Piwi domain-containing protein n=1 Tax=Haemonchus placei TaxID=6290 RepID=A0A0N4XB77_HAEPC